MFCMKCGKPLEEGQTLCSDCAAQELAQVPEAAPVEQPAEVTELEQTVAPAEASEAEQMPESDCDTFELSTADSEPVQKAPKKKGGLIAAIVAAVVVVAAAIGIVLNLGSIGGFIDRNFKSPAKYFYDVESAAIAQYSAVLTQAYSVALESESFDQTENKTDLRLTLGDDILSFLETALQQEGLSLDMDWLRQIRLVYNTNLQESAAQMFLSLGLGDHKLLSADVIMDMEGGNAYIGIPELNDAYLSEEMGAMAVYDFGGIQNRGKELVQNLLNELPEEEAWNQLINTYVGIVLSGIKNVEKTEEMVTVGGASQKMVILTATISEAELIDIAEAVLKQAQNDETIKKVFTAYTNYTNEFASFMDSQYYEPVDYYKDFQDSLPEVFDSLTEAKAEVLDTNYMTLKVYVDMKSRIRGHELAVYTEGELELEPIRYVTVQENKVNYTEFVAEELLLTGETTTNKGAVDGCYTLSVEGEKVGTFEFEAVTVTGGTVRFIPSEMVIDGILADSGIPASLLAGNVTLELTYSVQSIHKIDYEVEVLVGEKALIGLTLSTERSEGDEITIPAEAVDSNDEENVMQWLEDAEFDNVLKALEDANVPKELVNLVSTYVDMLKSQLN